MTIPTILIGLGGIGSKIVDSVYSRIPVASRSNVAVLAFDTNINDILDLKNLNKSNIIQTSTGWTVRQYLSFSHPSVKEWFPHEVRELQMKSLTDGAGQVRAVSRLAYRSAMEANKLSGLEKNLTAIFGADGSGLSASPRVMIVCSLAGGTGAGMFIQTALYIRDILSKKYQRENVLIRGAFLLPDTLVNTGKISQNQINNVRANAYASIKELNAMLNTSLTEVAIELEYKPNQIDPEGNLNHVYDSVAPPFDFCFMFDFENLRGENLQYFENYISQVEDSVFLDLFSPISKSRFSQQDNDIIDLISNQSLSRYCGSGVAKLVYPYQEILDFFSLKWIVDNLSRDWLELDRLWATDITEYKREIKNGGYLDKPIRGQRYIFHLEKMATGEKPKPFFSTIYKSAFERLEDGNTGQSKAQLFIDAIEEEIERLFDTDRKIQRASQMLTIDENELKDKDRVNDVITDHEHYLNNYHKVIKEFIQKTKNYLSNQITIADEGAPNLMEGKSYHMNTWVLGKTEPMHPVAVRLFLYQVEDMLSTYIEDLTHEVSGLKTSIKNYQNAYDDPETDEIESAAMQLENVLNRGFLTTILKGSAFKEFLDTYRTLSGRQKNNLNRFKIASLSNEVFQSLLADVRILIKNWERFFENLEDVENNLRRELNKTTHEHEKISNPSTVFVLSSSEMKEKLLEKASRYHDVSDILPAELSHQFYESQYLRFCKEKQGRYVKEEKVEKVEAIFRDDVLKWWRKELESLDAINLNCIQALKQEAEFNGEDIDDLDSLEGYYKQKISEINNLASPLIPTAIGNQGSEFNAWGMNPACVTELTQETKNVLFQDNLVEDPAFSEYEIIRNKTKFGYKITDFPKFKIASEHFDEGVYYEAYRKRIQKLESTDPTQKTVTPHLDKRWHTPYYLPELDSNVVLKNEKEICNALTFGLIEESIKSEKRQNISGWKLYTPSYTKLLKVDSTTAKGSVYSLYQALRRDMSAVKVILDQSDDNFIKDRERYQRELKSYKFMAGAYDVFLASTKAKMNILDILISYMDDIDAKESDFNVLLDSYVEGLIAKIEKIYGSDVPEFPLKKCLTLMNQLRKGSSKYNKLKAGNSVKNYIDQVIEGLK
ncbi:MAG: tubulin-like doman-containing protein [Bacteroidota bacterium]